MTATIHSTEPIRSSTMNELLVRAIAQDRIRQQDERHRAEYARRLVVLRRRQRKADAARRALAVWSYR
jgi:FixJ family two-component response regulator